MIAKKAISLFLIIVTLSILNGCSKQASIELSTYNLPERKITFSYPSGYNIVKDPYNKRVGSVWILREPNSEEGTIYDFEKGVCFTGDVWTGNEEIIDGKPFFKKKEKNGESYYYYEKYPETRDCTSFSLNSKDKTEKRLFENMIHSIKFIK